MSGDRILKQVGTVSAIMALQVGLVATVANSSAAAEQSEFLQCADELVIAGLTPRAAAEACSKALKPEELSLCVLSMVDGADVPTAFATESCFGVRRPDELATCVLEIDEVFLPDDPRSVVESCRKSLLPLRFSDCVVGVGIGGELATADALELCLAIDKK